MVNGSDVHDWAFNLPFKNFGPKVKIIDNLVVTQVKSSITTSKTNGKQFYGLDFGIGVKLLFGVDLKIKTGFKY